MPVTIEKDPIYGYQPSLAEKEVQMGINDMLRSQWKQGVQERTDAIKMAKFNALGNVLQTAFAPVAWKAGGATAQPPQGDQQGYITAFNRVLQADKDLSNIGRRGGELMLNYKMNQAEKENAYANRAALLKQEHDYKMERLAEAKANNLAAIQARRETQLELQRNAAELRKKYFFMTKNQTFTDQKLADRLTADALNDFNAAMDKWNQGGYQEGMEQPRLEDYIKTAAEAYNSRVGNGKVVKPKTGTGHIEF